MKSGIRVNHSITIPEHEITITASRSGGAGGQHVNKTSTRITVRWNIKTSQALSDVQRERLLIKLHNKLTGEGDLIIHSSSSRSQQQNKEQALKRLATEIRKALYVPKKRLKTAVSESAQQKRLEHKKQRSEIKKGRSKRINYE